MCEVPLVQKILEDSDEEEDIMLDLSKEGDGEEDDDMTYLDPMEREFIQIMR